MTEAVTSSRLRVAGLTKSYPGVQALSDLTLGVDQGEIVGLVGENGAGKSTLLNILSGVERPDSGRIEVDGREARFSSYKDANKAGIFRVFQEQATIPGLRVYESLFLSHERSFRRRVPGLDRAGMIERSRQAAARFGLEVDVRRPIGELDVGLRQSLEIVRAIALADLLEAENPILLLDEPTTALDSAQDERFLKLISDLRARATIVFVSHRLQEVLGVCDRIVVLKDGELVARTDASELDEPKLHELMVGRERAANYYREAEQTGSRESEDGPVLRVENISIAGELAPTSFDVAPGEVVGIGGLQGSGRSLLGQAIAGIVPADTGTVSVKGSAPLTPSFRKLIDRGLAWVPGDRHTDGMIGDATVLSNFQMASLHDKFSTAGVWKRGTARTEAKRWIEDLDIRPQRTDVKLAQLSGGNQQKVVLAKWLCREPSVVILENPTQGVDTGARESIYEVIRRLTVSGVGVVLVTDDLTELIGLSDRIMVLVGGRVAGTLEAPPNEKPDEKEVVALMSLETVEAAA